MPFRSFLHAELEARYQAQHDTVFIHEMGVCQGKARVDIAVVNGRLHGYEIKSERDNLRRLSSQATMYNRVFDEITLFCSYKHTTKALDLIPLWWEVVQTIPDGHEPVFQTVREGKNNPNRDIRAIVELLWKNEAMALLSERHFLRGLKGKPRAVIWEKVCELFTLEEVSSAVRAHLKATADLRGRSEPR